jgi:amino acid transporter
VETQEISSTAAAAAVPRTGLRRDYLSLIENLAQTLGVLTPSGTISVIIPLLIVSAGNGTWLLLLVTLSIFLLVMMSVMRFAALYPSAGSLATYSQLGWGPNGGLIGGWIYLLGISFCVPSALLASASYFELALVPWFGPTVSQFRLQIILILVSIGCWLAAYRDIKLSTNLMLVIECVSVSLMLAMLTAGMFITGAWRDPAQLHLTGVHFSGLQGGLVLAFMLMAGFEGTTSLGEESQDPGETIPKAIFRCMLPLTVLYLLISYCLVSLENHGAISAQRNGLTVPFVSIANAIHWPLLGPLSSLGVALSYFACGLASLTVASRVLYSMARNGYFWQRFAQVHPFNATPHRAITLISALSLIVPVAMLALGAELSVSINVLSQLGSLGLIAAYLIVVIALPIYLRREGLLRSTDLVLTAAASAMLVIVLILSIYPRPAAPYDRLPYLFAACLLVGILISVWRLMSAAGRSAQQKLI